MRVAGFGFRAGATLATLRDLLAQVEALGGSADRMATIPEKAEADALTALAAERGLELLAVAVDGINTPTQSPRITALHGTGSVAEAAALAAAGPHARVTVRRITAPDQTATCAMAETEGLLQ